jgi:hypothetical protein
MEVAYAFNSAINILNATSIKEEFSMPFCCPCHVCTLMKKTIELLGKTDTQNFFMAREKNLFVGVMVVIKSFLHLSQHYPDHPTRKGHP